MYIYIYIYICYSNQCFSVVHRDQTKHHLNICSGFPVFIIIVIFTTFRLIYSLAFFRCVSNSEAYTKLRTTSFI